MMMMMTTVDDDDGDDDDNTNIGKTSNVNDLDNYLLCKNFEYTSSYFGKFFAIFLRQFRRMQAQYLETSRSCLFITSSSRRAGQTR
jgi:hypothetical protein